MAWSCVSRLWRQSIRPLLSRSITLWHIRPDSVKEPTRKHMSDFLQATTGWDTSVLSSIRSLQLQYEQAEFDISTLQEVFKRLPYLTSIGIRGARFTEQPFAIFSSRRSLALQKLAISGSHGNALTGLATFLHQFSHVRTLELDSLALDEREPLPPRLIADQSSDLRVEELRMTIPKFGFVSYMNALRSVGAFANVGTLALRVFDSFQMSDLVQVLHACSRTVRTLDLLVCEVHPWLLHGQGPSALSHTRVF